MRKFEDLKELLEKKKNEELMQEHNKASEQQTNELTNKRRRKPNQLYENDDITLFRDDFLLSKSKKRKMSKLNGGHYQNTDSDYRNQTTSTHLHNGKKSKTDKYRNNEREKDYER